MLSTPPSLLDRVRSPSDHAAWERFVQLYSPLLFTWGKRLGSGDHEAADFVQEVLIHLVKKMPEFVYDPDRRFRAWLWTLARNKHREIGRRRQGDSALPLDFEPGTEELMPDWVEQEYYTYVLRRAVEIAKTDFEETTWKIFWAVAVEHRSPQEVAVSFGVRPGAVYVAKSRVLRTLRAELRGLIDDDF